jgi:hypothetical protein
MTPHTEPIIDLMVRFIDALHADPNAPPPPGLDAADIAIARDLARLHARPALGNTQRERIWQRALAEAIRQRLAQGTQPISHTQSNGQYVRQETEPMLAKSTLSQPRPRQRATSHGIWITGLVAAVCALIIGGLLIANPGNSVPPDESVSGAGSPLIERNTTPTFSATGILPMIQAVSDIEIRQGPGPEYPVILTLTEGGSVTVIGRTEDKSWHQVLLPDGTKGWIATPTYGESSLYLGFGDIDDVPIIGATEDEVTGTATFTPAVPPPSSATATPVVPPPSSATATPLVPPAIDSTPTPMVPPPSAATPTLIPTVTAPMPFAAGRQLTTENVRQINEELRLGTDLTELLAWSPDGRHLAVASETRITLYEAGNLRASPMVLEGHAQPIISLAYNPAGTLLASASEDGTVRLWDAQAGDLLTVLRICDLCDVEHVSFNPDGSVLMVEAENDMRLWSLPQQ